MLMSNATITAMKLGELIYRRKYSSDYFLDKELKKSLGKAFYFYIGDAFEIEEFKTCKQPCYLVAKLFTLGKSIAYAIVDKRNI